MNKLLISKTLILASTVCNHTLFLFIPFFFYFWSPLSTVQFPSRNVFKLHDFSHYVAYGESDSKMNKYRQVYLCFRTSQGMYKNRVKYDRRIFDIFEIFFFKSKLSIMIYYLLMIKCVQRSQKYQLMISSYLEITNDRFQISTQYLKVTKYI